MTERKCSTCKLDKDFPNDYYKHPRGPKGYSSQCKGCYRKSNKKWEAKNHSKRKEYRTRYRENGGSIKEAEYYKQWAKDNYDRIKDYRRMGDQKRRAQKRCVRYNDHVHPLVVLERDDGICGVCREDIDPLNFQIDHIAPLCKGGDHSYENVQLAHPLCNARKGSKLSI